MLTFTTVDTGGGCAALYARFADMYILITGWNATPPEEHEGVDVALYPLTEGETLGGDKPLTYRTFTSWRVAEQILRAAETEEELLRILHNCGCGTPGYFISHDDPPTLQRCDECNLFANDMEAYKQWAKDGFPGEPDVVAGVRKRHNALMFTNAKLEAMARTDLEDFAMDMIRVLYPDFLYEGPDWSGADVCDALSQVISKRGLIGG